MVFHFIRNLQAHPLCLWLTPLLFGLKPSPPLELTSCWNFLVFCSRQVGVWGILSHKLSFLSCSSAFLTSYLFQ